MKESLPYPDKGLVVRRFKKDIKGQVGEDFQERQYVPPLTTNASSAEEAAYDAVLAIPFTQSGKRLSGRSYELQRIGMQKALFSSPAAAIQSTEARMKRLDASDANTEEVIAEYEALEEFLKTLRSIGKGDFSKYRLLIDTLMLGENAWSGREPDDRIVLFSERIETLNWLKANLEQDLGLKPAQIALLHGQLPDTEQQELVDRFGRKNDPVRILLCSDVASEGLNLHYFCHRVIHFDMPWSLMTYLQRNGRVDRFGQTKRPVIVYLQTLAKNEKIRGDQRILEVLEKKDRQANTNLGDPLAFLDEYDAEREEEAVSGFMAEGMAADIVDKVLEETAANSTSSQFDQFNALMAAFGKSDAETEAPKVEEHVSGKSLFGGHYEFARSTLELLRMRGRDVQWNGDDASETITLTAPQDLQARLRQIPREAQHTPYVLNARADRIMEEMEAARQAKEEDDTWPKVQYLWPQHPISEWLADCVISEFRGHKAPAVRSQKLPKGEMGFLIAGTIPNRKGQPVVMDWQVVVREPAGQVHLEPFDDYAARAGLAARALPNAGQSVPAALQTALPGAVNAMRSHMVKAQQEFDAAMRPRLEQALSDLDKLRDRQMDQLELDLGASGQPEQIRKAKAKARTEDIERAFRDYRGWVHDTMETEPQPFLQVIAAVHNLEGQS